MKVEGIPQLIPSLLSVSTAPTQINLATANRDSQGLGNRALCKITFKDHPHTDFRVDPYVDGRSWNPLDRGTFWGKWTIRNKYRQNIIIRIYEGYVGEALVDMTKRTYFLQSVKGPGGSDRVTIEGKDILARIEERKAQAPAASPGQLYADLNDTDTSFEVALATEDDYAASGTLMIDEELMTYTSRANSTNGVTFSGITRGTDGTVADEHSAEESVQQCVRYTQANVDDVITDLLVNYGGIDSGFIDTTSFTEETQSFLGFYLLDTIITEPTAVSTLVSQIQEQVSAYIWWDERETKIKMKAIRGILDPAPTITDDANILEGSFSLSEKPKERTSQVWIWYGRDDYTKGIKEPLSYANLYVEANLESESEELYGEPSIRKIYANWLRTAALSNTTASKIITRYVDIPSVCTFRMDAKDRQYWVGDDVNISHYLDVDEFGARRVRQWTITSAEEVVPGEVVQYTAEDTTLYGRMYFIMADGSADYPGYGLAPWKNCYIGNADGLLSDGQRAGTIG